MTTQQSDSETGKRTSEQSEPETGSPGAEAAPAAGEASGDTLDLQAGEPTKEQTSSPPPAQEHLAAGKHADASAAAGEGSPTAIAYCVRCGAAMAVADLFCHACGWDTRVPLPAVRRETNPSDRNRLAALLLCLLLGWLGAHRFYAGKVGTGVVWLLTFGFIGIGVIYDLVLIATGEFRDGGGRRVVSWE